MKSVTYRPTLRKFRVGPVKRNTLYYTVLANVQILSRQDAIRLVLEENSWWKRNPLAGLAPSGGNTLEQKFPKQEKPLSHDDKLIKREL